MGRRTKRVQRCVGCRLHVADCLCAHIPQITLKTRIALVMHQRERHKTTATAPLALAALTNSERHLHGVRDAPLDLRHLHAQGRRVLLLFPSENAQLLNHAIKQDDERAITLVVPDGTWRQARRVPKRVMGLQDTPHVKLPPGPPSRWGVRHEPMVAGLATLEAIARALGIVESPTAQQQLEALLDRASSATLATRGTRPQVLPAEKAASQLQILYQDEHLVAINKPAALAVHRGWSRDDSVAVQLLRDQLGRYVYPIHRLDRATSGVLIFALTSEVARDMQQLFATGAMTKRYWALCRGHDSQLARIDHALAKDGDAQKRPAQTDFRFLGRFERYGLYEALPRTGRTHQIRRHLKHASHPIVGDVRYGKGEHNRVFRERYGFHRLALHCHSMAFEHPRGAGPMEVRAPLTADFAQLLAALGLDRELLE